MPSPYLLLSSFHPHFHQTHLLHQYPYFHLTTYILLCLYSLGFLVSLLELASFSDWDVLWQPCLPPYHWWATGVLISILNVLWTRVHLKSLYKCFTYSVITLYHSLPMNFSTSNWRDTQTPKSSIFVLGELGTCYLVWCWICHLVSSHTVGLVVSSFLQQNSVTAATVIFLPYSQAHKAIKH